MKILWFVLLFVFSDFAVRVQSKSTNVEIINGQNSSIENHPWLISIWQEYPEPTFLCAGFLISTSWAVTTTTCLLNNVTYVRAGSSIYKSGGVTANITESIHHPTFDWGTLDGDIAVLKLETPLAGENIEPIALPDPGSVTIETGDIFNVAGWGHTHSYLNILSDILLEVNITAFSTEDCRKIYGEVIVDNMICGGGIRDGIKGPCGGDEGGPVLLDGVPVAMVSLYYDCSVYPSIFTNLLNYVQWIHDVTGI